MTEYEDQEWSGIVKIQLPLAGDMTQALFTSEDNAIEHQFPITDELRECFPDGVVKIYCYATVIGTTLLTFPDTEIEEQHW